MEKDLNIELVARKAGVSTATVSRAMNGLDCVRPETAKRVWEAVRALQYYPNAHARTLGSGRSRTLGLIISDICNPFFPDLVKSFEAVAMERGYEALLTNTNYDPKRMKSCVRRMLERRVEGVAIMTSEMDKEMLEELSSRGVPVVFLDAGKVENRISNIRVRYSQGIGEALDHLYALGHRRIGFLSGPSNLGSARTRRSAFLKGIRKHGIAEEPELVQEGVHRIEGGEAATERLLALARPPSALLASNDLMAIGAMRAIGRHGLRVPEDVSVVGFDDIELGQLTVPALTTIRLSRSELGEKAFRALFRVLESEKEKGAEYTVETHLVIRQSTGPFKHATRRGSSRSLLPPGRKTLPIG
jgi:LacI family transcriptional regulator